ncbi:PPK2 family polyphosphate kinase [Trueperella sp. LYQ143]|uniref:PPK2 family polyphosphate kinase n=1 Tax=Trueperella sp. LYQ143 TaxID=3391059 RepID=UPI0039836C1E
MSSRKRTGSWNTPASEALRMPAGFDLSTFDRASTPGFSGSKSSSKKVLAARGQVLDALQERFFAQARSGDTRKLLVIVQGLDTAGKGGLARHVLGLVDPQGVHIANFGKPTEEELSHHFLWRITRKLPPAGKIGYFDRSHYEDVLIGRVDKLAPAEEIEKRYEEINAWEQSLIDDGFTLIKVGLMISHHEQGLRLAERLARKDKWWKYSSGDIDTRKKWDAYQEAYQIMFERTNTPYAPWFIIPADKKWYARLAVTELIIEALEAYQQNWPVPRWHLDVQIRRLTETLPKPSRAAKKLLKKARALAEKSSRATPNGNEEEKADDPDTEAN